ncbi:16S rRNA (uracil(1498)-N(3))-methyltransferase [Geofilum sp. OHC36d9]|uniref:16S rRNA (uracil(1498)-N(3))-methyltransferase n=1 Tax=Geofilum sp. OHC36d9 TaxID=3458413 RepID=UPI00403366A4
MQLFYEPEILVNGGVLSPEESNHCIRVLRHQAGDVINILNGKGHLFEARITDASPKKCRVEIQAKKDEAAPLYICHIAIAPTKNIDRTEWFMEKSTEIGIEEITPIFCSNSERKVIKPERLEKVIIAATKQSISLWRPILNPAITFSEFVKKPFAGDKFIAHCQEGNTVHLKTAAQKGNNTLILIGPEGDFSEAEIKMALEYGFKPISLGRKRLRTETAALTACHIIRIIND